jgi:hypothetical protein
VQRTIFLEKRVLCPESKLILGQNLAVSCPRR